MIGAVRDTFVPSVGGRSLRPLAYAPSARRAVTRSGTHSFPSGAGRRFNQFPQAPGARSARLAYAPSARRAVARSGLLRSPVPMMVDTSFVAGCWTSRVCATFRRSDLSHLIPLNPGESRQEMPVPVPPGGVRGVARAGYRRYGPVRCLAAGPSLSQRTVAGAPGSVCMDLYSFHNGSNGPFSSDLSKRRQVPRSRRVRASAGRAGPQAPVSGFRCGIVTVNSAYSPAADCGVMAPPWARTISWERLMPSPVPRSAARHVDMEFQIALDTRGGYGVAAPAGRRG